MILTDVPVDPDAPEARQWLLDELAKPPYQAAQPTWFDRISKAFWDWLGGLFSGGGDAGLLVAAVLAALVLTAIIVAVAVYGVPRLNRRAQVADAVFAGDDGRSAAELRRSADAAAAASDWPLAIEERFRALARDLDDRALVSVLPGTTAAGVAAGAADAFPEAADALARAARSFDGVRYLGRPGSRAEYDEVAGLDARLARERVAAVPA